MNLRQFIEEGRELVRTTYPSVNKEILAILAEKTLKVGIGDEEVLVAFLREGIRFPARASRRPDLTFRSSREAFFSLVDGRLLMAQAVTGRDLDIIGDCQSIFSFYRALELLLKGARASPALVRLVERFREGR